MKKLTLPEIPDVQKSPDVSVGELCTWYSASLRYKSATFFGGWGWGGGVNL